MDPLFRGLGWCAFLVPLVRCPFSRGDFRCPRVVRWLTSAAASCSKLNIPPRPDKGSRGQAAGTRPAIALHILLSGSDRAGVVSQLVGDDVSTLCRQVRSLRSNQHVRQHDRVPKRGFWVWGRGLARRAAEGRQIWVAWLGWELRNCQDWNGWLGVGSRVSSICDVVSHAPKIGSWV